MATTESSTHDDVVVHDRITFTDRGTSIDGWHALDDWQFAISADKSHLVMRTADGSNYLAERIPADVLDFLWPFRKWAWAMIETREIPIPEAQECVAREVLGLAWDASLDPVPDLDLAAEFAAAREDVPLVHAAEQAKALRGRTALELLSEVPEEPDWLVPGMLAPGWIVKIAGREKLGKGTFIFYLLGCLERGEASALGPSAEASAVIYTEEPTDSIREKVEAFGLRAARILFHHDLSDLPSWTEKARELTRIAEEDGHAIVFVDNFSRAAAIEDEAGPEMARALEVFAAQVRGRGLSGIVDHHHKKGNGPLEDKSRGSTAVAGATDVNVELSKAGGGWTSRRRKLSARGRLSSTIWERTIELAEDGRSYTTIGDGDGGDEMDAGRQRIIADAMTLVEMGETTAPAFMARLGVKSVTTARDRLNALVAEGRAVRELDGKAHVWRTINQAS